MENKNEIISDKENPRDVVLEYIGEKDEKKNGDAQLAKESEIREKLENENLRKKNESERPISIKKEELENIRNIISEPKNPSKDNSNYDITDSRKGGKKGAKKNKSFKANKKIILKMIVIICILSVIFLGLTALAHHYGCVGKFSQNFLKISECSR